MNFRVFEPLATLWPDLMARLPLYHSPQKSNKINASDISFSQALTLTGSGQNRLAREATAAVLNARDEDVNYRFTEEKVINSTYNALISGDAQTISNLATIFENQNTLGL